MMDTNDDSLVAVFHAEYPELLPLAEGVLQQERIEYLIRSVDRRLPVGFGHPPEFSGAEGVADIFVAPADAARALDLLADLAQDPVASPGSTPMPSPPDAVPPPAGPVTHRLTESDSGTTIGDITERQLQYLVDELEEESETDRDYYIDAATIDMLEADGADAALVAMLRRAVGTRDGVEIGWEKL
jgi:hypothetical protein